MTLIIQRRITAVCSVCSWERGFEEVGLIPTECPQCLKDKKYEVDQARFVRLETPLDLPDEPWAHEAWDEVNKGNAIPAIKLIRAYGNMGLRDSLYFVHEMMGK